MRTVPRRQPGEQLMAVLGHELRNPLAAAMTGVAALGELVDGDDPRRPLVDRARADLERLARLLSAYLDFGRASHPRRERVDLASLAHDLVCRRRHIHVHAIDPVPVHADPRLLERVVENLVENAFAAGAGKVEISVRERDGRAILQVRDDGPGVPAELRGRLFEPGCSGRGSSGLGLAIVADIVQSYGGSVRLLPGEGGACFQVSLPAGAEAVLPAS